MIIIIILLLWYYLHAITIHWIMIDIVIVIVIICNGSIYSMAWLGLNDWLHLWHDRSISYQEHTLSSLSSLNSVQFIILCSSAFYHYSSNVIVYYHFSWHYHCDTITTAYIIIIWISKHLERENKNDVMLSSFFFHWTSFITSLAFFFLSLIILLRIIASSVILQVKLPQHPTAYPCISFFIWL